MPKSLDLDACRVDAVQPSLPKRDPFEPGTGQA
jgi:hypothetical protein